MTKTEPNKAPPGMCSQKKTGSMNSFSQTDERKYYQPDSNSLANVEKKNKNCHENKDCAHTENMDVGKFQVVIKKKIERQPSRELPQIKK
jgi:hypothetical protein